MITQALICLIQANEAVQCEQYVRQVETVQEQVVEKDSFEGDFRAILNGLGI